MEQTKIEVQNRRQAESHQACLNGRGAKEEGEANKTAPDKGNDKEKPKQERTPLTEAERLRRQKMIVLPAMVLVFLGAMWLIFAPSSDETKEPGMDGYNMEMPDADKADRQIIGDKAKAYEQGAMEERKENRNRSMMELGDMFDREVAGNESAADFSLTANDSAEKSEPATPQSIRSSASAYRDLNTTLGSFYEQPKEENAEMEELLERIASLESELESEKDKASDMDDQVALMEKSYELAAKYMNGQNGQTVPPQPGQIAQVAPSAPVQGKGNATPVKSVSDRTVSGLQQPMSNAEFVAEYSKPRNYGFNTAVGSGYSIGKNTIRACVHNDQTLMDGQTVKLRLLEPLQAGNVIVPKNSLVSGSAKVQGERLDILVSSLEYAGNIIPVELAVYDSDGQKGLSVPSSLEQEAAKEAMANIGAGLGTSISFAQSAGQQVAMDITRGLMQGGSQYLAKKFRTVKVHLKANYQVMLYAKQQ